MAKTRIKVASVPTPYIRVAPSTDEDYASHDIAHSEALSTGLGSSVDFELHGDAKTTWAEIHKTLSSTTPAALTAKAAIVGIWIKHSGYKESTKLTATNETLRIHLNTAASNQAASFQAHSYFSLEPNESIFLHAPFGASLNDSSDIGLASSNTGGLYEEVIKIQEEDS